MATEIRSISPELTWGNVLNYLHASVKKPRNGLIQIQTFILRDNGLFPLETPQEITSYPHNHLLSLCPLPLLSFQTLLLPVFPAGVPIESPKHESGPHTPPPHPHTSFSMLLLVWTDLMLLKLLFCTWQRGFYSCSASVVLGQHLWGLTHRLWCKVKCLGGTMFIFSQKTLLLFFEDCSASYLWKQHV